MCQECFISSKRSVTNPYPDSLLQSSIVFHTKSAGGSQLTMLQVLEYTAMSPEGPVKFYCLLHRWEEFVQTMFIAYLMAIACSLLFCWYAFLTHGTNGKYSNKKKWMLGKTAFHIRRWMWLCLIWCLEPLQLSWDNEGRYCPQTEDAKGKDRKVPKSIIALGCWTKLEPIAFELLMRNNK